MLSHHGAFQFDRWGLAGVSSPDACPQILSISEMIEMGLSVSMISVCLSFLYSFPNCCCGYMADMPKLVICDLDLEKKHVRLTTLETQEYTHPNTNRSEYFCLSAACDGRVTSCASVWRMPSDWETGNNESPEDSAHNPQTLELLCHLENNSHSNTAW